MIQGRDQWEIKLLRDFENVEEPVVWFHCASLGEFEQGRPVLEAYNTVYPHHKILLTFFSPSGYSVRKDYPLAYAVHYLPWDTAVNARKFYQLVNPVAGFIIKYEFWYHLIDEGNKRNIPVILFSSIFHRKQIFFRAYGGLFRKMLVKLDHLFVQNEVSRELLSGIGIKSVTVAGDTRVDRVTSIAQNTARNEVLEQFKSGSELFIIGSSWSPDIEVLSTLINSDTHLKFVIAPHEISEKQINHLEATIKRPLTRYTNYDHSCQAEVLVVDTIGILSHLYQYGKYAYIGGAFGKGLHNILEAATFGLPLFFGNRNYLKFTEAETLVKLGGAFAIGSSSELLLHFQELEQDKHRYHEASATCRRYIEQHRGATTRIMDYVKDRLPQA